VSEVYQCAFCGKCFPVIQAIDGYSKGFREGFLCPLCGINIEETGESNKDITNLRFGYTYLAFTIGAYIVVNEHWFMLDAFEHELANLIFTVFVTLIIPTLAFIYVNRKILFGETIVSTKRIVNSTL
jgi:hypothetical protein